MKTWPRRTVRRVYYCVKIFVREKTCWFHGVVPHQYDHYIRTPTAFTSTRAATSLHDSFGDAFVLRHRSSSLRKREMYNTNDTSHVTNQVAGPVRGNRRVFSLKTPRRLLHILQMRGTDLVYIVNKGMMSLLIPPLLRQKQGREMSHEGSRGSPRA